MFFSIRHGERADLSPEKNELEQIELIKDPHLSKVGCLQAQQTGRLLLKLIEEYRNAKQLEKIEIILISSPFLRTIMTAQHIAQALLQIDYKIKLRIDNQICEFLANYEQFPNNIINGYLHYHNNIQKIQNQYLKGINQLQIKEIENQVIENHPQNKESYSQLYKRVQNGIINLEKQFIFNNQNQIQYEKIVVIVTHKGIIDEIVNQFDNESFGADTKYCGILGWEYQILKEENDFKRKIIINPNFDHLAHQQ